ncbi:hypothetical protein GH5_02950 [Leishmania sp. Ghana 2012 LV757]|uniref:hypothetical protein n=1 Tax=Leishmania sp. Ghana 2012 LV757 TaxID=2803181 RepID=UPI001B4DD680|nr:hypothetical protein GH5_02950 [Leishmania sp. Ghana 2012 LV757]
MAFSTLPYITRDVATEPPTTIVIVPCGGQPPELLSKDEAVFAVTEDCVEPTKGWINREGKPLLTVCFMHSFGKCVGRTNSNPATCFQIHIKANVLHALRRHYTSPTRRFFTRTVKALLSPELRQLLCMCAHKEFKVQYLEYRVSDVFPSAGLLQYEATYRRWLFSDDTSAEHAGTITVLQCLQFSVTGSCNSGTDCPYIHADLKKAQARDPMLACALRDLSDVTRGLPTVPVCVPCSLQPSHQLSFSPVDDVYPQNGMPSDPPRIITKVPACAVACGEGKSDECLAPSQMFEYASSTRLVLGHANGAHQLDRLSFVTHGATTPGKPVAESGNIEKTSDGKSGSGWVSSGNEGVSSSSQQTGSSGSGSD